MGDGRSNRVGSALSALIQTLIPPLTDEDDASRDERRDDALALATSIIDGLVPFSPACFSSSPADVCKAIHDHPWYLTSVIHPIESSGRVRHHNVI